MELMLSYTRVETAEHGTQTTLYCLFFFIADEPAGTSKEELSCGEVEAPESQETTSVGSHEQILKGMLMRKYSGHLRNLRKEFLKNRKKDKLPKDARTMLLDWWNHQSRWPYPTVIFTTL
ncbi:HOMEOBOX PROTEIN KNOTTED-1-LIKE 10 [Salix viminalis]|uniref:HOMEOBOX PROTEIN KNOTTED-1-LIKE 10 n=1 Tax=Salix viminalis TaxID=40686 RepID=A0A9Q0UWL6_SALVM|nr:HOMEOBOX PROTEIN KNOTTED-1-LIKE 10 [Salix viminalis]